MPTWAQSISSDEYQDMNNPEICESNDDEFECICGTDLAALGDCNCTSFTPDHPLRIYQGVQPFMVLEKFQGHSREEVRR